jgi:hypothetical protein
MSLSEPVEFDLEHALREAVGRAYAAARLRPAHGEIADLARTYARWAEAADDGVVERLERKLTAFLTGRG